MAPVGGCVRVCAWACAHREGGVALEYAAALRTPRTHPWQLPAWQHPFFRPLPQPHAFLAVGACTAPQVAHACMHASFRLSNPPMRSARTPHTSPAPPIPTPTPPHPQHPLHRLSFLVAKRLGGSKGGNDVGAIGGAWEPQVGHEGRGQGPHPTPGRTRAARTHGTCLPEQACLLAQRRKGMNCVGLSGQQGVWHLWYLQKP